MEAELMLMEMLLEAVPPITEWALSDSSEEEEQQRGDSEPESGPPASPGDDSGTPEPEPDSTSSESQSHDEYSDEAWGIVPQPYPEAAYPAPYRAVSDGLEWWPVVARQELIWRPLEDQVALGPTWFLRRGTDPQADESKTVKP